TRVVLRRLHSTHGSEVIVARRVRGEAGGGFERTLLRSHCCGVSTCYGPFALWRQHSRPAERRPSGFQSPRRSQTSRRSSYTVIGSPKRPRPWLRIVKPRLAAR